MQGRSDVPDRPETNQTSQTKRGSQVHESWSGEFAKSQRGRHTSTGDCCR